MIPHWKVVQEVASRFGDRQIFFEAAAGKLTALYENQLPLVQLEDDHERISFRIARERTPVVQMALERIIDSDDFNDKFVLDRLSNLSAAVCRIVRRGRPLGTGFLVADDVIMTNHHVIESEEDTRDMVAEFNYELDGVTKVLKRSISFRLNPEKFFLTSSLEVSKTVLNSGLDFTLVGVEITSLENEPLSQFAPIKLDGNPGKIIKGESCVIIQHPNGLPKKVALKDTRFFSETGTRLVYETDTLPGSSGSPVFGLGTCEVIALHHCGLSRTDDQNRVLTKNGSLATPDTPDDQIDWIGNEGIRVSVIVNAIQQASLAPSMESRRRALLRTTEESGRQLQKILADEEIKERVTDMRESARINIPVKTMSIPIASNPKESAMYTQRLTNTSQLTSFIISIVNKPENIRRVESVLSVKYSMELQIELMTPAIAVSGVEELFSFEVNFVGNPHEEAKEIAKIPGIYYAEADIPLYMNADTSFVRECTNKQAESGGLMEDGYGVPNEEIFIATYAGKSPYVVAGRPNEYRRWNWTATGFDRALGALKNISPMREGIRVVQFDTGFTDHSKVVGGFDLDDDYDFISNSSDAIDRRTVAFGKYPGHATRTGSILIGNEFCLAEKNGNCGLLTPVNMQIVPFRIAETVVLINRQRELAAALDAAIAQGFDVIVMSMGIPPTLTTARLARKAYENGVIWCCAAGNEVGAVVAPAVFPGTISVAASNPLDKAWNGSSSGDRVDITAPGEAVYVPIWQEKENYPEGFAYGDGTSYAAPHIAAAAAYWLAKYREDLTGKNYGGWKRVEAFRQALKTSARKEHCLPGGFGEGILDMEKLLETEPPEEINDSQHAYAGWNENAFLNTLQGWTEAIKTYWNVFHESFFGRRRGKEESIRYEMISLSESTCNLESAMLKQHYSPYEATGVLDKAALLERLNMINAIVQNAAK